MVLGVGTITAESAKRTWGKALATARREAGLSQADVAHATRNTETPLTQKSISNAERGIGSLEAYVAIDNALGTNVLGLAP